MSAKRKQASGSEKWKSAKLTLRKLSHAAKKALTNIKTVFAAQDRVKEEK